MNRLFGTDGVRGIANAGLSCELAMKIGQAGAYVLANEVHNPRILVGMDTRRSGDMLAAALSAGICSVGGDVIDVDVIPTPAMAYLVRQYEADAAVMISASHNSMEYNGIKWFDGRGFKLSDELEDAIEKLIHDGTELPHPTGAHVGHIITGKRAREQYIEFLRSTSKVRLDGLKVVIDCANGASSSIAREVFSGLGADVRAYANEPDGSNINDLCGSTHPERLQELVASSDADVGFAFDGDADRVIATDELGNIVDGDRILGICAQSMKSAGTLKNDTLVITVMSNLGLKLKMKEFGINIAETAVGDRYVLECMIKNGYNIGGEQSGHIIFSELNTTGDGMLTAIQVMNIMKTTGSRMSALASDIPVFPQVLVNVTVPEDRKKLALDDDELNKLADIFRTNMGESGRVLIRASGTEPLIRIMIEGQDVDAISHDAIALAKVIESNHEGKIKT